MHLPSLSLAILALANAAAADYAITTWRCPIPTLASGACQGGGRWFTNSGVYTVNADDGCRGTSIPYINQVCFDWKAGRGHFYAENQPKRCLRKGPDGPTDFCEGRPQYSCLTVTWSEVACTW